jgi:dTDP-4-dehydrorhamnose reductase
MERILVTGSNGLLGQKLVYALASKSDVLCFATGKGPNRIKLQQGYTYFDVDLTDTLALNNLIDEVKPTCIINTAALTNVDACESKKDEAYLLNVTVVNTLIALCKAYEIHLIHLSTDFVFDGTEGPYDEAAEPNPLSYYASTKLEAEQNIQRELNHYAIIRTIIIYGVVDDNSRSNVVLWTINALKNKQPIKVISDQVRTPTLAEDLADACLAAAILKAQGIYHVSGSESMTILEMVNRVADFFKLDKQFIHPISTASLNQAAKRPLTTGFIISKAQKDLNFKPHNLEQGLKIVEMQLKPFDVI